MNMQNTKNTKFDSESYWNNVFDGETEIKKITAYILLTSQIQGFHYLLLNFSQIKEI